MTATECAIRQAMRENVFSAAIHPETLERIIKALKLANDFDLALMAGASHEGYMAIGELKGAAAVALGWLTADRDVCDKYGVKT